MEYVLEVKNVTKQFDTFRLDNISFNLEPGYIMGFIGSNGAGKSTTIKLIMNLIKKNSGEIKVFGKDHIKYEKEIKERIGFVYDESYFYEDLSITQMKNIVASFYKAWDDQQFRKYIKEFDLDPKLKIKKLSKGMKMKLSLALALSHHADLIIMDEPTSGLDPLVRKFLLEEIETISKRDKTSFLFSSHIISDLQDIAHSIIILKNGRIIYYSSVDELLNRYPKDKKFDDIVLSLLEGG